MKPYHIRITSYNVCYTKLLRTLARVGGQPRTLQVPVDMAAIRQALLAQQLAAAIAQLTGPDAELVAAVHLGNP